MVTADRRESGCERGGRAAVLATVREHFYRDCTLARRTDKSTCIIIYSSSQCYIVLHSTVQYRSASHGDPILAPSLRADLAPAHDVHAGAATAGAPQAGLHATQCIHRHGSELVQQSPTLPTSATCRLLLAARGLWLAGVRLRDGATDHAVR